MMRHSVKQLLFTIIISGMLVSPVIAMEQLEDEQMANVTGQEGVALDLEFRVNADSDGNALSSVGNLSLIHI